MATLAAPTQLDLTDQQIARIASKKIFFGHQSVGNNIVDGIKDLAVTDARLKINIVKSADPQSIPGPAFVEFDIGQNRDPKSKNNAFKDILAKGMGQQGGFVLFKYCYIDIDASTNVQQMFESYRNEISFLKGSYPALRIIHVTVPLTTVDWGVKTWIKGIVGRPTAQDANVKRNEFNRLLRQAYATVDPIFDLADIESTRPDGSRSYFKRGDQIVFTLAPEYTTDGGHLNELGRRATAAGLLHTLSGS